jgi:hypothetical protein
MKTKEASFNSKLRADVIIQNAVQHGHGGGRHVEIKQAYIWAHNTGTIHKTHCKTHRHDMYEVPKLFSLVYYLQVRRAMVQQL